VTIAVVLFFIAWFLTSAILFYIFKMEVGWAILVGFIITILIGVVFLS